VVALIAPPFHPVHQSRVTVRRTRELCALHERLLHRCATSIAVALDNCEVSCELGRGAVPVPFQCAFYLRARVADHKVLALWRRNQLIVHPRLAERARLVVDLGETFQVGENELSVSAGLGDPLRAALTLMRAADEILEFKYCRDGLDVNYGTRNSLEPDP
jgi:hypothetical protein